jgi:hypothetical protein
MFAAAVVVAAFAAITALLFATTTPLIPTDSVAVTAPAKVIDQTGDWPDAPVNSQYGTIKSTYDCSLEAAGFLPVFDFELPVSMTGIFPLTAGPDQPFYITDGKGSADLPPSVVDRLRSRGIRQVSGEMTEVNILALGSRQKERNALSRAQKIPATPLVKDKPLTIALPRKGSFTIGPFSAPDHTVEIGLGALRGTLKGVFVHGLNPRIPLKLDCAQPSPINLVALITIGGPASSKPLKIPGTLTPATVPPDSGLLSAVIPYPCTMPDYGRYVFPTNVNAFVQQLFTRPGATWQFLHGHGYVTVPKELIARLRARHPGAVSATVTLNLLGTIAQNSSPTIQNYLRRPVPSDPIPLRAGKAVVGYFPSGGNLLPPENFVAGKVGITRVWLGDTAGTVRMSDASGRPIGRPVPFICPTMRPLIPLIPYVVAAPGAD